MKHQSDYENRIESLTEEWDARIEILAAEARHAGPGFKQKYDEAIRSLILNREAARRGLIRVEESGELCSSCPQESGREQDSPVESLGDHVESKLYRVLNSQLDVTESPRTTYGRENP